ncbi:DNA internalization-related competence protein ComEC/Rec2 [Pseudomonas chengduensis]|nr:DNA internalization-related competence protein ComEC/Rec2 [Pseudomonas chengduensis]MDH0621961.1 DNA internalization-related competence protein ComEC/Rec2 [Pseudomonas chengduensis]MDH1210400.1 DNA internalization-related competence protein ComEC/Rec2 [Pseudomonas chengduensis]MDH1537895.1 DNA internalization-related competence protein ComEC/Rec2 [Pseudomonas chengduensis]MDH1664217.1 DNA internalization-related competence protein ComEC/Rec2 [Pseudomonas chengduensis]MDH1680188.1 DNA intern
MRTGMLALALGLLSLRFLPALPPGWLLAIAACVGLALLLSRLYPLGFFLLGLAWACSSAQSALDDRLAAQLDGRTLWLEGRVVGLPEVSEGVVRFLLEEAHSRRAELPQRLRVAWYGGPTVQGGERWRLAVNLKRPHGLVNPQRFDYEAWLLAQRIGATGTIKSGERLSSATGLGSWRDSLRQRLLAVPAFERQGAIAALVLGDGSGLSASDWRLLQHTGTVHLMVISGQHIALLAGFLYGLVALLARVGAWPRRWPWLPCACALALSGALVYGMLAGFEVPVRRACVMVALVLLWRMRFRHLGAWWPLLLALLVVLLLEPLASLQPGFWLSFSAVAILALVFGGRLGVWGWWRGLTRAQWTMAIGLLPMMLILGLPVSSSGPLANLVAVPWVGLVVVPLALLGTLLLPVPVVGEGLLWLAGGALYLLFELLSVIAAWLPAWLPSNLPLWAWLLAAAGALLLLLPAGVPLRLPGLALLLPALLLPTQHLDDGRADVWVLDVGQGLAVLVRTREHSLLYDAGPRFGDFDTGERIVLPSLRAMNLRRLDLMLLSHADNDHAGGAAAIKAGMPVARVISGEPQRLAEVLGAEACESGRSWQWNDVTFRLWQWQRASSGNQRSCVLQVEARGERLLLTGDIDILAERALMQADFPLASRWLLAPHHGSRTSSSQAFIDAVGAQHVLITRSRHNAFGHPHPQVLARYQAAGVEVHDTALRGALHLRLGEQVAPRGLRSEPRFWREK